MAHPEIRVKVDSRRWRNTIKRFQRRSPSERKKALYQSGGLLIKAMKGKLAGPGHTRGSRSSPYPGAGHTGNLARTMFVDVESDGSGMRCGPHEMYAVPLEFRLPKSGTSKVRKPFVLDSWTEQAERVFKIISGRMFGLLK